MERLTEIINGVVTYVGPECTYSAGITAGEMSAETVRKVMRKLAAYEDTGLEPNDIPTGIELANVYAAMLLLKQYQGIGPVEEFRALKEEEQKRREGCRYCHDASFHQYGEYVDGQGEVMGVNNCCINCGRDLRGESHE